MAAAVIALRLRPGDAVAVVGASAPAGTDLQVGDMVVRVTEDVPAGHKVAVADVPAGGEVRKYGQVIGLATRPIAAGQHVHSHNLAFAPVGHDYAFCADLDAARLGAAASPATFEGILRSDGRVATRNYIGILTTVNCSATVAKMVAGRFHKELGLLDEFARVDGVVALTHGSGCGMAGSGEGFEVLRRTLAGYAAHPNFAGIVVLGLGCEVNQVRSLTEDFGPDVTAPVVAMTIQGSGGTRSTVEEATRAVLEMAEQANDVHRVPVPASRLVLGLECGGSDGYSGITANPALGAAADLVVQQGGTVVLGETPEIYGAEHLLTRRATTPEVGKRLVERIRWWESYVSALGASLDNNPSPGNKEGGLTTILEKSLGAVAKAGSSPLTAVYEYAQHVGTPGFVFMDTPGYDPVSVTGMVAGGANVICFTTGRGSVFGSKPAPCLKLATNSAMYRRMEDDMDVNCGAILDGETTVATLGEEIFRKVLEVASGRPSKSEALGFGEEEFTPWQIGAVL